MLGHRLNCPTLVSEAVLTLSWWPQADSMTVPDWVLSGLISV